ncbi:hypothetical protein LINGRAPRIM_LOCUS764 [Linum grandiflorum]
MTWPWTARAILSNPELARGKPHLEQLKLTSLRFNPNEMELLCHFLRSGHNLKTVTDLLGLAAPLEVGRSRRRCVQLRPPTYDYLSQFAD